MKTGLTKTNLLAGIEQRFRKGGNIGFRALENMQCQTLGTFGADAGETLKLLDQASEGTGIDRTTSTIAGDLGIMGRMIGGAGLGTVE